MTTPRTRHECPICKTIVFNDTPSFHEHLTTKCAPKLFELYPDLRGEVFNSLWHKLADLVRKKYIIPSPQKGAPATIKPYQMDLEAMDRNIDFLRNRERQRTRDQAVQRKHYQKQMEREIRAELQNDELTRSMPRKLPKNVSENFSHGRNNLNSQNNPKNYSKKRRLLYHNTSDMRPPKRMNIDPEISVNSLRHKVRESRRDYHNVSYLNFVENNGNDGKNEKFGNQSVDQNGPIIHTQRALSRYLSNCEVLRKCFHGDLFRKIGDKSQRVYGQNCENLMGAAIQEIKTWNGFEIEVTEEKKEDGNDMDLKEEFLSSWDAIPQQTELFQLDSLLRKEHLSGVKEKPHSFWNASDNVECKGYDPSMFANANNKTFVKL